MPAARSSIRQERSWRSRELTSSTCKKKQRLAELHVKEIEAQLRQRTIASPITGQVIRLHKESGEYVAAIKPIVATVIQLDKLRVKFYVEGSVAQRIQAGDQLPLVFTGDASARFGTG